MPINAFQLHVTMPYFSAIPEDVVTNVWSLKFVTLAPTLTDWGLARARFITFYNAVYGATGFTAAPWMRLANTRWKGYDLNDPQPRAPRYDTTAALTPSVPANSVCTPETAVCLSFQGTQTSGIPQARRRGRIFLGGLAAPITPGTTTIFPLVASAATATVTTAASALKTGLTADGWTWSVYSRTDDAMVTVDNGWIDNAPDTQRRRGQAPSLRTLWS